MTTRRSKILFLLVSLIVLASCAPTTPEASADEVMQLKIGIAPFISFAPLFIAQEEGYFEQAGLEVEFVNLPRSGDLIPAISQGDIDVGGIIVATSTINLIEQGENIRFVADRGTLNSDGCTYYGLMARTDLADTTPADMAGSHLATDEATFHEYFMDYVLATGGLTPDDVTKESVVAPSIPELLGSAQVDYATLSEPWLTRIENSGQGTTWLRGQEVMPDVQFLYYIFGPSILEDNRELGTRFMKAYVLAKAQYDQGRTDRNVEIVMQYTDLDEKIVRDACWVTLRDDLGINSDDLMTYQAWSVERGYGDVIVDAADLVDTSFIEEALSTANQP